MATQQSGPSYRQCQWWADLLRPIATGTRLAACSAPGSAGGSQCKHQAARTGQRGLYSRISRGAIKGWVGAGEGAKSNRAPWSPNENANRA